MNKNSNKFKIILIIIVLFLIIFMLNIIKNKCYDNNDDNIKFSFNNKNLKFYGREIYLNRNELSIGEKIKELENGFYDFKIKIINENLINIYFNKLYKEFKKEELYSDEYLENIILYINNILDINLESKLFKDIIVENYCKIRESKEYIKINNYYKLKNNNNIIILVKVENVNNVLKIEMRI